MMNQIPISDARENLPAIVADIAKYYTRKTITVRGVPRAVLISAEELESLEETAELLAIPGLMASIRRAEKEIKEGKVITLEELKKKLESKTSKKTKSV